MEEPQYLWDSDQVPTGAVVTSRLQAARLVAPQTGGSWSLLLYLSFPSLQPGHSVVLSRAWGLLFTIAGKHGGATETSQKREEACPWA